MPVEFNITTATSRVELDKKTRRGQASCLVANISGKPVRGRAQLRSSTQDIITNQWVTLDGAAERDYAVAGNQQFTIQIAVPASAPATTTPFTFWMEVIDVANPDEVCDKGQEIAFAVPEAPVVKPGFQFKWWMAAIAAGVILLIALVIFLIARANSKPIVPQNIIGMTESEARSALENSCANPRPCLIPNVNYKAVSGNTLGVVTEVIPPAGTRLDPGTTVVVFISQVLVPNNIIGQTEDQAKNSLINACQAVPCLNPVMQYNVIFTTLPEAVTATNPPPGTLVNPGSSVTVTYRKRKLVTIPDLGGKDPTTATGVLVNLCPLSPCLNVTQVLVISRAGLIGLVVNTKPPAGTQVEPGSPVQLQVGRGLGLPLPQPLPLPKP